MALSKQQGFMLPGVIIMSTAILVIALAITQLVISNNQSVVRAMYDQVAQTAAKSGIDYAKEEFLNTGAYTGTSPEVTIIQNGTYRVTFEVTVLETSTDGLEKKIESIGRVYLPELSTTQLLLRSVRSEIIRTVATELTPDQLTPLAWYDADDNPTLHKATGGSVNWTHLNTDTNDYMGERTSNGTQSNGSWNSAWVTLGHDSILNSSVYAGAMFSMSGIPKGATINSAFVRFEPQGTSTGLGWFEIKALAASGVSASNSFSGPPATNQLRNKPLLTPSETWVILSWPAVFMTQDTPDIKDHVQATLNQSDFDPATDYMALRFERIFGIGSHRFKKGRASLNVNYTVTTPSAVGEGDEVVTWDDKSGNGHHLIAPFGREPTYRVNQQNTKPMLEFPYSGSSNNGKYMTSQLFDLVNQAEAGTVFVVSKNNSTAGIDASLVRMEGEVASEPNCVGASPCNRRVYEMARSGGASGLSFYIERSGPGGLSTQTTNTPSIFTGSGNANMVTGGVAFASGSCNPSLAQAAIDIADNNVTTSSCPSSGQSYPKFFKDGLTINIANGRNGARFGGHIGEVIIYDKQLSCKQVQSIQKYLRIKWFADNSDNSIINCPAPPIPGF